MNTPERIESLKDNEVFVFGSNEAGIHGAGAAKLAHQKFGAVYGVGFGLRGKSFAIPTKDRKIQTLPLVRIKIYILQFIMFAGENPDLTFYVTKIGCGLAGYSEMDIKWCFYSIRKKLHKFPSNIILPIEFE